MATFDQRGQQVITQYNAETINIGIDAAKSPLDLAAEMDKIKELIAQARGNGELTELQESKAKTSLLEAAEEARQPEPDKESWQGFWRLRRLSWKQLGRLKVSSIW